MGYPVSSRPRVASWCPLLRPEEELTQQGVNGAQDSLPSASGGRPQTSALHSCGRTASRSWDSPVAGGWPWVCPVCLRLRTDVDVCTAQDLENVHPSLWAGSTSFGKSARRKLPQGPLCGSPSHLLWRPVLVLDLKFIWKVACEENGSWSPLLCAFLTVAAAPSARHRLQSAAVRVLVATWVLLASAPSRLQWGSSWPPWVLLASAPNQLQWGSSRLP